MWASTFGKPAPEDLEFTFATLWQTDALDKATNAKTNAETITGAYEAGLLPQASAMQELRGLSGETGLFGNITDEDIAGAEEDLPPMPDEAYQIGEDPEKEEPSQIAKSDEPPVKTGDAKPRGFWKWISGS